MPISLRSQMIAGTAAFCSAAAVCVTPIAPTASTALSSTNSAVALSALADPISAMIGTGQLGLNFLINDSYSDDPLANWGEAAGIGDLWNSQLQGISDPFWGFLPRMTSVGLIPNLIEVPFPILSQLLANQLENGNTSATDRFNLAIERAGAAMEAINVTLEELVPTLTYHMDYLTFTINNIITAVTDALAAGDFEAAWNAGVAGLLGPNGLPGVMLNLTIGAGIQIDAEDQFTFIPSLRTALQTGAQKVAGALAPYEQPEVTEPEVTEPEVTEPEVTEPEVTEPEVTEPQVGDDATVEVGDLADDTATGDSTSDAAASDTASDGAAVEAGDTDSSDSTTTARAPRADRQAAAADNAGSSAGE